MTLRLETEEVAGWPALGWLAGCSRERRRIHVLHGPRVEVGDGFACEAVWPGRFEHGGFDRTATVAGTGVRVRGGEVKFVASASAIDRLHSVDLADGPVVSNSLPCLLAAVGVEPRLDYWRYQLDLQTVMLGLGRYRRTLPTTGPPARITYFHNLVWSGESLRDEAKPLDPAGFRSFDDYLAFLRAGLAGVAQNGASAARRHPYEMLSTISSGYDGVAVTALAAEVGCRRALTFDRSRLDEPDSGEEAARALDVEPIVLQTATWRDRAALHDHLYEAPFLAAMPTGHLATFGAARDHLAGRLVFTGFFGGQIWSMNPRDTTPLARTDFSGLTLSEFRLGAGFINCDPAAWAGRQIEDVVRISRSDEMRPWVGDVSPPAYRRPIPRRIAEEAGVPRASFGRRKQPGVGGSLTAQREFLATESLRDYRSWSRRRAPELPGRVLLGLAAIEGPARAVGRLARAAERAGRRSSGGRARAAVGRRIARRTVRLRPLAHGIAGRLFTFHWAVTRVGERYALPPGHRTPAS